MQTACLMLFVAAAAVSAPPVAMAATPSVLHAFTDSPDGSFPDGMIRDSSGNLYGTTSSGGIFGCANTGGEGTPDECGVVFRVTSRGRETVLYAFTGFADGGHPYGGVSRDGKGNLYGTTEGNGMNDEPSTLWKLSPKGKLTVLHTFKGAKGDGCCADNPPVVDADGNLYGATPYGGDPKCEGNPEQVACGTVYEYTASGSYKIVHTFEPSNGIQPTGGLSVDSAGNVYGTTFYGGDLDCLPPLGCGVVFKIDTGGNFSVLYAFTGQSDGSVPFWGVTPDANGNLFGATADAGDLSCGEGYGCGTIFEITNSGQFRLLHTFEDVRAGGDYSRLALDASGNLYGVEGGNNGPDAEGFLYELDTAGQFTDVYDITDSGKYGQDPVNIIRDDTGAFYVDMGAYGHANICCGTVFKLAP